MMRDRVSLSTVSIHACTICTVTRASRCLCNVLGKAPPRIRTPASMFFSMAWPVRLALEMKQSSSSQTATFAWTMPPANSSLLSFQKQTRADGRGCPHACYTVDGHAPAVSVTGFEQHGQDDAAIGGRRQRGHDRRHVVGDEAGEKESVARGVDDLEQRLLGLARRDELARRAGPDEFRLGLGAGLTINVTRPEQHALRVRPKGYPTHASRPSGGRVVFSRRDSSTRCSAPQRMPLPAVREWSPPGARSSRAACSRRGRISLRAVSPRHPSIEERRIGDFQGGDDQRAIEIAVSPLARSFRYEGTGMTGRGVQRAILLRLVLRTERIGRTDTGA